MQESRLFGILYRLINSGQSTSAQLAKEFEVSQRTIYRDIDALSAAGIPVYAESGRNGGIRLMKNFVLNKAVFSEKEKQDILSALQSLNAAGNIDNSKTIAKLSALFETNAENWFEADFSRWCSQSSDNIKFEQLKNAVIQYKCVNITYAGSGKETGSRKIHPLKLMYKSKAWYLKAYCTERQDFRTFRLNRIISVEPLDESFTPMPYPEEKTQPPNLTEFVFRFSAKAAYRVYDEFDLSQIHFEENGDLTVSTEMPYDSWIIGFLLSVSTDVEIIKPVSLKKVLAQQAKLIYEKNKS